MRRRAVPRCGLHIGDAAAALAQAVGGGVSRDAANEMASRAVERADSLPHQAAGGCLQTTVVRLESTGVTVSVGVAPSLSATRWERTLSGGIRETSRSMFGRLCAQSRMAAAASVAYPCPQCARVKAQPSSG